MEQLGAAAVGADAGLEGVYAQHSAAAFLQFKTVLLPGQLLLGVGGGAEAEAAALDAPAALAVVQTHIGTIVMAAVFR